MIDNVTLYGGLKLDVRNVTSNVELSGSGVFGKPVTTVLATGE